MSPPSIVLVQTSHPGNIGATARAMKNMGLADLVLVRPNGFPSEEADRRASGAEDLLAQARVVDTLGAAVADRRLVIGTSARSRAVSWPVLAPREAAMLLRSVSGNDGAAVVFGRESSGLSNAELDLCTHLVHIPTAPDFSSLNVAMAVQLICYEWFVASETEIIAADEAVSATASSAELEGFFGHLAQALDDIGFTDERRSDKLMRRLRRLFHRAAPDSDEIHILRGILSAAQGRKSMRR